ncbi:hypothetical protein [Endozoicomonas lisbonensis]|uniref:Peptidase C58 YopT-type domain-containing protein n=1 Tax=Endozoicomonas lisbonensis TaxID=3120522 RepID=A0ABV2SFT0_9GAMM
MTIIKMFSTRGYKTTAIDVRWNKKRAGRYVSFEPVWDINNAGICTAATLTWLRKSIATEGRGVRSVDELGPPYLMAIIQGAYTRGTIPFVNKDKYKLDKFDGIPALISSQNLTPGESARGAGFFDPTFVINWVSRKPCHCLFAFLHPAGESGHMIGLRYDGQIIETFDPNFGLYQYSDTGICKEFMRALVVEYYLYSLGGEWIVYEVKPPAQE